MIAVLDESIFLCSKVSPSKMPPLEIDDLWRKFHRFPTRPPTTKQTQKPNLGRPQGFQGRLDNKQPWPVRPVPLEPKQRKILFQDAEGDEKIARDFRLQINKIAPENFSKIILKMKDVKITTKEALKKVVDLVTLTAIQQPKYAHTYAEMCEALVKHWEKEGSDPGTNATSDFKKVLLNTMQVYFQSKPPELEGDAAKAYTPEEREKINKERILGTVRFVGELYIRRVIFVNIVRSCIEYLIKPSNDSDLPNTENLESLIKLLTTVGKTLDNKVAIKSEPKAEASNKNIVFLDHIFNQLKSLSENPALETRLRMLLQNLKELRGNKWNLRIQEMKATTLSLAAAAPEATFTGVARSQADQRKAPPKDRYEAMLDSPVKEKPPTEDWTVAKGKGSKPPRRLKKQASEPLAERTKFALLAEDTQEAQSPEASAAASVPSVKAVASAEEAKMRLDRCFREYLDAKDKADTRAQFKELGTREYNYMIISDGILHFMEARGSPVESLVELIIDLYDQEMLNTTEIDEGFKNFFELYEDSEPDYPKIADHTATILAKLISQGIMSMGTVFSKSLMETILESEHGEPPSQKLFLKMSAKLNEKDISKMCKGFKLETVFPGIDKAELLAKHPDLKKFGSEL